MTDDTKSVRKIVSRSLVDSRLCGSELRNAESRISAEQWGEQRKRHRNQSKYGAGIEKTPSVFSIPKFKNSRSESYDSSLYRQKQERRFSNRK